MRKRRMPKIEWPFCSMQYIWSEVIGFNNT
jgi:hypothetical protein